MAATHSAPSIKKLYVRLGIEIGAYFVIGVAVLSSIKLSGKEPHQRGFYCNDQGIDKPFIKDEQVPVMTCFFIWASVASVVLVGVELVHGLVYRPILYRDLKVPPIVIELYRIIGSFVLGATFTMVITEMVKVTIGEFRPHFLSICGLSTNCTEVGWRIDFDFNTECSNKFEDLSEQKWKKKLTDARKSFLSGHSSFSFFSAVFLALYLKSRLSDLRRQERYMGNKTGIVWAEWILLGLKALRPFLQFAFIALAFFIALTRVSDYYHHPRDVIAGGLFGTLGAFLTYTEIARLPNKPRVFHSLNYDDSSPMMLLEMDDIDGKKPKTDIEGLKAETDDGKKTEETEPLNQEIESPKEIIIDRRKTVV